MASAMSMAARSLVFEQEVKNLPKDFGAWLRLQGLVDGSTWAFLFDESDEEELSSRIGDTLKCASAG